MSYVVYIEIEEGPEIGTLAIAVADKVNDLDTEGYQINSFEVYRRDEDDETGEMMSLVTNNYVQGTEGVRLTPDLDDGYADGLNE